MLTVACLIVVVDCIKNVVFELSKCEHCLKLQRQHKCYGVSCWKNNCCGLIWDCIAFINTPCSITEQGLYYTCAITVGEPRLWYTAIQGTPPFRGHKILLWKNVYIIFVFFTSTEGTPLFRGKGHYLWVPKPRVNLHWGYTLPLKKWLTTKITDNFKCTLVKNGDSFQSMQYLSDLLHLWEFKTQTSQI